MSDAETPRISTRLEKYVAFNWNAKNPSGDDNPEFSKKFSISIH